MDQNFFKIADPIHHEDLFKIAENEINKIEKEYTNINKYNLLIKMFDKADIINDFEICN